MSAAKVEMSAAHRFGTGYAKLHKQPVRKSGSRSAKAGAARAGAGAGAPAPNLFDTSKKYTFENPLGFKDPGYIHNDEYISAVDLWVTRDGRVGLIEVDEGEFHAPNPPRLYPVPVHELTLVDLAPINAAIAAASASASASASAAAAAAKPNSFWDHLYKFCTGSSCPKGGRRKTRSRSNGRRQTRSRRRL